MRKTITTLIILILLIFGGTWYWLNQDKQIEEGLIYFVERNIPPEHEARLTAQIAELQRKIDDRLGDNKSMEDLDNWIELSNTYYILGNLREARATLIETLDLNEINYVAWGNYGNVLTEMGDLAGARQAYQKAIEYSNADVYVLKYIDFLREHYPDETEEYEDFLKKAVEQRGQKPEFISRLAEFYMAQERYEEAVSHYEVLVGLTPDNRNILKDLSRARQKLAESQQSE